MRKRLTRRGSAIWAAAGIGLLCSLTGGCSPGINWRGLMFDPVHADAQRDNKLTFVYFRNWAVPACTRFEENVLKDPAILQAVAELYCAVLDFHLDRQLAGNWGIAAPPGVAIVDPNRRVLTRLSGEVSVAELLAAIQAAKDEFASGSKPAPTP